MNWGSGDDKQAVVLPRRFQKAIDDAAMVADKNTASEYVGEWRRDVILMDPGPEGTDGIAEKEAQRLRDAFPRERLARFVANGGYDPDTRP